MTIYSHISINIWKTYLIMFLFVVFVATFSWLIAQALGVDIYFSIIAIVISLLVSFASYFYSNKIILTIAGAKKANRESNFKLYTIVENLSVASGLPVPEVYIIEDPAMNAFATGRDPKHAVVAATSGLVSNLANSELEGVIGHELSHIKNYDIRLMAIVAVLVGTISILADIFFRVRFRTSRKGGAIIVVLAIIAAILAPIVATLIQLAISRRREYLADADGALLTRYPEGLARALSKISTDHNQLRNTSTAIAHLYISNPFNSRQTRSWITNLFSTHPPVEERIKALRTM